MVGENARSRHHDKILRYEEHPQDRDRENTPPDEAHGGVYAVQALLTWGTKTPPLTKIGSGGGEGSWKGSARDREDFVALLPVRGLEEHLFARLMTHEGRAERGIRGDEVVDRVGLDR